MKKFHINISSSKMFWICYNSQNPTEEYLYFEIEDRHRTIHSYFKEYKHKETLYFHNLLKEQYWK